MIQGNKADIISRLEKEILPLQGIKSIKFKSDPGRGLGLINESFPNQVFPLGAIHEFIYYKKEEEAVSCGFLTALLSIYLNKSVVIWITASLEIFPAALKSIGIAPENLIFIQTKNEKETLWVMEESLKCEGVFAVIADVRELNFTVSRRLQLVVEQSLVTGFILRNNPRQLNTTASVTRWKIFPEPGLTEDDLPGLNFPRWKVELLKCRNGRPGNWIVDWKNGTFLFAKDEMEVGVHERRKTG